MISISFFGIPNDWVVALLFGHSLFKFVKTRLTHSCRFKVTKFWNSYKLIAALYTEAFATVSTMLDLLFLLWSLEFCLTWSTVVRKVRWNPDRRSLWLKRCSRYKNARSWFFEPSWAFHGCKLLIGHHKHLRVVSCSAHTSPTAWYKTVTWT